MPTFSYSARNLSGEILNGEIELPTRDEVVGYLVKQRLRPISVNAKARDLNLSFGLAFTETGRSRWRTSQPTTSSRLGRSISPVVSSPVAPRAL